MEETGTGPNNCTKETRQSDRCVMPPTHLFPVVEDDELAVLVVDRHIALVALTCKHEPVSHTSVSTDTGIALYCTWQMCENALWSFNESIRIKYQWF